MVYTDRYRIYDIRRKRVLKFKVCMFTLIASVYLLFSSGFMWIEANDQLQIARNLVKTGSLSTKQNLSGLQIQGKNGFWYDPHGLMNVFALMPIAILECFIGRTVKKEDLGQLLTFLGSLIGIIISSLVCIMFFAILQLFGRPLKTCFYASICLAFLTIIFPHASKCYEGSLNMVFMLSSLYFLFKFLEKKIFYNLICCGIFAGLSINTRDFSLLFLFCMIFFMIWLSRVQGNPKIILIFFAALFPFFILWGYINWLKTGIFYLPALLALGLSRVDTRGLPTGSLLLGLKGLLSSKGGSIFAYSPILILSFFGWKKFFKSKKKEATLIFSIVSIFILANAKLLGWFGFWCWGPRYTLEITSLMMLPLGYWLSKDVLRNKMKKLVFLVILIYSLIVQLSAVLVNWHGRLGYLLERKGIDAVLFTIRYSQWWDSIKTLFINLWNLLFGSFLYLETSGYDSRMSAVSLYMSKTLFTWWNRLIFMGVNPFWIFVYIFFTVVIICYCLFYLINFIGKESV